MGHARSAHRIGAPIEHVWALAAAGDRFGEWNPYWRMRHLSGPLDLEGTTFDESMRVVEWSFEGEGKVLDVVPMHLIHLTTVSPAIGPIDTRLLFDQDGDGTLCTLDVEYRLPARMTRNAMHRTDMDHYIEAQTRRMVDHFASFAESREAADAEKSAVVTS